MDSTQKQILEKLTQLIGLYNSMASNSKKISELQEVLDGTGYYLAISDGAGTFKTEYKPNEVTQADFDNLKNMQLGANPADPAILVKDGQGNIITTLNLDFITESSVKYTLQAPTTLQQEQARDNIDAVGNPEMQATPVPDWKTDLESLINF